MPSILIMPSENAFKKQAEAASEALKAFVAVQNLKSTIIVKAAMTELVDATVGFNAFIPFFVSHALFQEIPPTVHTVLEKFSIENPSFDMPPGIAKIAGLNARARDTMMTAKRGTLLYSRSLHTHCLFIRGRRCTCRQRYHEETEGFFSKFLLPH